MRFWSLFFLSFYLILELLVPKAYCQTRMVLIYGSVTSSGTSTSTTFKTVEDCKNGCFEKEDCIMMYFMLEKCRFYSYATNGQSFSILAQSKSYVAIKTDASNIPNNTCPDTFTNIKFSYTSPATGDTYSFKKNSTGLSYTSCKTDWKRFERADGTFVCMNIVLSNGTTYTKAQERCQELGGTVTGVASVEESKFLQTKVPGPQPKGFWIGGGRNCPTVPCSSFRWVDGYTTSYDALVPSNAALTVSKNTDANSENYLTVFASNGTPLTINDINQDFTSLIVGFVCGYKIL
ncbi:C-type lectin domain-containing protein [Caenorhabditis elegans]|uniref:C-type lectin domain-containing protein n=1 Tax=Caenorhabditis elegans TaxID=6239 RepID=Q18LB7_CAEEL|nr:C-type lectin domain-containing protein [Caenorhabditis elegans]CAK55193.1 C-type lectin domain-containing protein [Caenorhabditis elegans]|eukprot:NP_001041188.1 C-type LECtin [Caenorhabditis elegans]